VVAQVYEGVGGLSVLSIDGKVGLINLSTEENVTCDIGDNEDMTSDMTSTMTSTMTSVVM
jgi:hypothetical protein